MPDYKRVLAIDYGSKRIGLALSDPLLLFSYAYKTIPNDNNLLPSLLKIIKEMDVDRIVLGLPYQDNGQLSRNASEIVNFKEVLAKEFNLEIIFWDESYSSETAKRMVIESVTKKSKRRDKGLIDKGSASVFLQEYLDSIKK